MSDRGKCLKLGEFRCDCGRLWYSDKEYELLPQKCRRCYNTVNPKISVKEESTMKNYLLMESLSCDADSNNVGFDKSRRNSTIDLKTLEDKDWHRSRRRSSCIDLRMSTLGGVDFINANVQDKSASELGKIRETPIFIIGAPEEDNRSIVDRANEISDMPDNFGSSRRGSVFQTIPEVPLRNILDPGQLELSGKASPSFSRALLAMNYHRSISVQSGSSSTRQYRNIVNTNVARNHYHNLNRTDSNISLYSSYVTLKRNARQRVSLSISSVESSIIGIKKHVCIACLNKPFCWVIVGFVCVLTFVLVAFEVASH